MVYWLELPEDGKRDRSDEVGGGGGFTVGDGECYVGEDGDPVYLPYRPMGDGAVGGGGWFPEDAVTLVSHIRGLKEVLTKDEIGLLLNMCEKLWPGITKEKN
jgi:hypothetical protein